MNEEQCTREDLMAVVPRYDRWTVNGVGEIGGLWDDGDQYADTNDIEEYVCNNCGEFFPPKERYSREALDEAWKAALAHLPKEAA